MPKGVIKIPFNKPYLTGKELEYMQVSMKSGNIVGDGEYTRRCEALLKKTFNARKVLLTNSCTDALEMASLLIGLEPGDEVIVPSYTFVSTVNAFVLRGAKPVNDKNAEDSYFSLPTKQAVRQFRKNGRKFFRLRNLKLAFEDYK